MTYILCGISFAIGAFFGFAFAACLAAGEDD